jgi:replicative DNA helicase Mcm
LTHSPDVDRSIDGVEEIQRDPNLIERLVESFAPSLYGLERVKLAILHHLVGGVPRSRNGQETRGATHVLVVGDHGTGKSQLLRSAHRLVDGSVWLSGPAVKVDSLPGITLEHNRSAIRDGSRHEADQGYLIVDRIDAMNGEARRMLETIMEQGKDVGAENSLGDLDTSFSVLAAANPTLGRYNPYQTVAQNICLPVSLMSRFDLIFVLRDIPDTETDLALAERILDLGQGSRKVIPHGLLRRYLKQATETRPELSYRTKVMLRDFYVDIRGVSPGANVAVSPRHLTSLVRLAEARAKLHLRDQVTESDAEAAIRMLSDSLEQVGVDPIATDYDLESAYTCRTTVLDSQLLKVVEVFAELEKISSTVRHTDLYDALYERYGMRWSTLAGYLRTLVREGVITCTSLGCFKRKQ